MIVHLPLPNTMEEEKKIPSENTQNTVGNRDFLVAFPQHPDLLYTGLSSLLRNVPRLQIIMKKRSWK